MSASWFAASRAEMKAVLHELAKAVRSGMVPSLSVGYSGKLVNDRPSTVTVAGQVVSLSAVIPDRRSASADATLNVEPGANWPRVAVDIPSPPAPLAAASTSPVDGRMATTALAGATVATTDSAAFCSPTSSVVVSGVPGVGSTV